MDNNQGYNIDVKVNNDKGLHYGDFALGVVVGTTIIPAIYGIYCKVKKIRQDVKARKAAEEEK